MQHLPKLEIQPDLSPNRAALLRYARRLAKYRQTPDELDRFTMLELAVNAGCNYKCAHCSASDLGTETNEQFSLPELERLLDQAAAAGFLTIVIVGGEPTIYRDIDALIGMIATRDMLPSMITNASRISPDRIQSWAAHGLATICFSMHGFSPVTHDRFVGVPGAFEKLLAAIEVGLAGGLNVTISVTPTRKLIESGEFSQILNFLREKDLAVNFNFPAVAGRYKDAEKSLLTAEELARVKREAEGLRQWSDFHIMGEKQKCIAAKNGIYVSPEGDVAPCAFIHISYGNVKQEPLDVILDRMRREPLFQKRHSACLVGENPAFVKDYILPIYAGGNDRPLDFRVHPALQRDRGELPSPASDALYRSVQSAGALIAGSIDEMRLYLEENRVGFRTLRDEIAVLILALLERRNQPIERAGQAYRKIVTAFLRNQRRYLASGRYPAQDNGIDHIKRAVYAAPDYMFDYLLHMLASHFLWPNKYDLLRAFEADFARLLPDDARILDVGVGGGYFLARLLKDNHRTALGLDFSDISLDFARDVLDLCAIDPARVRLEKTDVTTMRIDRGFDAIIFSEVIEHVEDPVGLLTHVCDLLAPGGMMYFATALNTATDDHLQVYVDEGELRVLIERQGMILLSEHVLPEFAARDMTRDQRRINKISAAYAAILVKPTTPSRAAHDD